jgi:hypothetical protein
MDNIKFDTSPQELTPEIKQLLDNNFIEMRRQERNKLLSDSDKYTLPDFPIATEDKIKILDYRQALRNFDFNDFSLTFPNNPLNK